MCKILLSIKPEYVERIFNNTKKYEYRRILAKNNVDSIVIYCSYPVKKIVGKLKVKSIIKKHCNWLKTELELGKSSCSVLDLTLLQLKSQEMKTKKIHVI